MSSSFTLVAGPCVLESEEHALEMGCAVAELGRKFGFEPIFKASFDKANRTSGQSFRGPGLKLGLDWLAKVRSATGLRLLTDIHESHQAAAAAEVVDILQIPAFLCRQTDLIEAAAQTGKALNLKKGQFMAPPDMAHAAKKAQEAGAASVALTERGVSFGYQNLVVDMRSIPWMQSAAGCPVWFDATHSVQLPSAESGRSGGQRRFVPYLVRAALAAGCDGLFIEVHSQPSRALSDAATQLSFQQFADVLSMTAQLLPVLGSLAKPEADLWEWA